MDLEWNTNETKDEKFFSKILSWWKENPPDIRYVLLQGGKI